MTKKVHDECKKFTNFLDMGPQQFKYLELSTKTNTHQRTSVNYQYNNSELQNL